MSTNIARGYARVGLRIKNASVYDDEDERPLPIGGLPHSLWEINLPPSQPTPNREQNQVYLNYAEMRRRGTLS